MSFVGDPESTAQLMSFIQSSNLLKVKAALLQLGA